MILFNDKKQTCFRKSIFVIFLLNEQIYFIYLHNDNFLSKKIARIVKPKFNSYAKTS